MQGVALPTIAQAFELSAGAAITAQTAFMLAGVITLLPAGLWADRRGRWEVLVTGSLLYTLAAVLAAAAPTFPILVMARVLQGVGAALYNTSAVAAVTRAFPPGERGRALGVLSLAAGLGLVGGPVLSGLLVALSWRLIFVVTAPLALAALILFLRVVTRDQPASGAPPRILRLLAVPNFRASALAGLLHNAATMTALITLPFLLERGQGRSPSEVGIMVSIVFLLYTVTSPLAGAASDRVSNRRITALGAWLFGAGVLLAYLAPTGPALPAALVVAGIGLGVFDAPNNSLLMSSAPPGGLGGASSILALVRTLGFTAGAAAAAGLLDWRTGALQALGVPPAAAVSDAGGAVLLVAVALALAAGLACLVLKRDPVPLPPAARAEPRYSRGP